MPLEMLKNLGTRPIWALRLRRDLHAVAASDDPLCIAAERVRQAMESGRVVCDRLFDQVYDLEFRKLSPLHWTPAHVATLLAKMLVTDSNSTVLDVGSGVGKFCVLGALATDGNFVGIEQRAGLVSVASDLAQKLRIDRANFLCGNALDLDWSPFSAFYLFNPFWENVDPSDAIDCSIPMSDDLYDRYVSCVQEKLSGCRVGTRVATLNGFGGAMPAGYKLAFRRFVNACYAEVWIKVC